MAILLLFISNASYTDIENVHIGLVMIHWGYKVGNQASIVPYTLFIQNQLVETCARAQSRKSSLSQPLSFCLFCGGLQKHDGAAHGAPVLPHVSHPLLQ